MRNRRIIGASLAVLVILVMAGSRKRADGSSDGQSAVTPVWAKRLVNVYGGVRVQRGLPDSQGGCLAVGDSGYVSDLDGWAIHFDKSGAILKQMSYGGKKHDRLTSICASTDTGYMAAGWTQFEGVGFTEKGGYGWLMKLGAELNPIWAKTFSASKTMNRFTRILKLNKAQGYLATMVFEDNYEWTHAILRLNSSGTVLWSYKLGDTQLDFDIAEILQASDGGFYLFGTVNDSSWSLDAVLIKLDANGHFKWAKTFGKASPVDERIESAYLTGGGDLMVFANSFHDSTGLALKLDSKGNVKWQYAYKDSLTFARGLSYGMPGEGGGFFFLGSFNNNGVRNLFAKCDSTGKILAKRSYLAFGGPAPNYDESVSQAFRSSDGGIFMLSNDVMPQDVVISKLNSSGNLPKDCDLLTFNLTRAKSNFKPADISVPYESVKVTVKSASLSSKILSLTASEACD